MARLLIKKHTNQQTEYIISKEIISIGKNEASQNLFNELAFEDETVSRRHARIYREKGDYFIEDLNSKNHTYLNDQRIKKARLRDGDEIKIGFNTLVFESETARQSVQATFTIRPDDLDKSQTMDLNYLVLHRISEMFNAAEDAESYVDSVIGLACQSTNAANGMIILLNKIQQPYYFTASDSQLTYSKSTVQKVIETSESILTSAQFDPTTTMLNRGIHSIMCVPLLHEGAVEGVIYVEDSSAKKFGKRDLMLLTSIANHIAMGLERVRLNKQVRKEATAKNQLERFLTSLQASEAANRALLNANPDLMLQLDRSGTIINCKLPKSEVPGLPGELPGKNVTEFLPGDVVKKFMEAIRKTGSEDSVNVFEFKMGADDDARYYESRIVSSGENDALAIVRDVTEIRTLRGLLPMCSACKKIRDDKGYWNQLELYIQEHTEAAFSHGMCPPCAKKWYGDYYKEKEDKPS